MHSLTFRYSATKDLINDRFSELKTREWKILVLLVDNFSNTEIMLALNLKRRTIVNLRHSIGEKLDLKGINTLSTFARLNRDLILERYNLFRMQEVLLFDTLNVTES